MRIVDVVESPVKACCQFNFHGWTVSVSTIFEPSVCAWNADNSDEIEGLTVQQVLDEILIRALQSKVNDSFIKRV